VKAELEPEDRRLRIDRTWRDADNGHAKSVWAKRQLAAAPPKFLAALGLKVAILV
jgi:hypothetical protein